MSGMQHNDFLPMQSGWREPLTPGLAISYNKERRSQSVNPSIRQSVNPSIRQSVNPSIRQSVNPSIRQSVNPSIRQSVNPSIRQSVNPSIKRSSALRALSVFRSFVSLPGLGSLRSLLFFKFSALAAPLRRCCSALVLAALSVAVAGAQPADDWVIETVAGGGSSLGDGGAATAALLSAPSGVAVDGAGNLYIADFNNHRIRKVNSAGVISTVAGTGTAGFSGDGGAATSAQLRNPQDVALDGAGNLYIVDTGDHRIRKVNSAGVISTVAGSGAQGFSGDGAAATAAQLNQPRGVALDGTGNLYIADWANHRIRKVDVSSGNISTVAGTGTAGFSGDGGAATSAQLDNPYGVAVDGASNLYIADGDNNRIRKVNSSGNISTVAGTGTAGFSGDGGAATSAQLDNPYVVALDGAGNLYIADGGNHRIRKVNSAGVISTVAGSGAQGFGGDGGAATAALLNFPIDVAPDALGNLYIAEWVNNRIRKVDSGGNITTVAGREQLNRPTDVAPDGAGNLYIADTDNHRIHKVDSAGVISTVAGSGTAGFSGDSSAATAAQLNTPADVAPDGAGNLYIADAGNHRIRKVDSAGVISTVAGSGTAGFSGDGGAATAAQLNIPAGVAPDGAGNLYIADTDNHRIRKVDSAGVISTVAGDGTSGFGGDGGAATAARLDGPTDVALDGTGNLYIADTGNDRIRKVDSAGVISTVAGDGTNGFSGDGGAAMAAQLNTPVGVALDALGNLYITDRFNHRIRKIATVPGFSAGILSTGVITTVAGDGTQGYGGDGGAATAAQLNQPIGVALDGAGNLYIADTDNNRIRKVGPPPPARPREPEPTVEPVGVFELSFTPAAEADPSEPMSQTLMLRAAGGAAEFEVLTSARWIEVSRSSGSASWKGRLAAGETVTLRVTVNPLGLRPGTHRGYVYIRSGGRASRVRIVLEVAPPTGPDVTESGGVLNAARMSAYGEAGPFGPPALALTPGSLVVVQGVNFLAGEPLAAADFPLPTSLEGVRVLFDGLEAPLFAVEPQRIEAQLPWALGGESLAAGGLALAEVVVEAGGKSSYPRRFWVGAYGPGVFTASGAGSGQAIALFAGTTALAAPSGFGAGSRPARAGEVLEIYATGLGPVDPPLADGMNSCLPAGVCLADGSNVVLRHTTERPRVSIGGVAVAADGVLFSGSAPTLAAVDMVLVEVPAGIEPSAAAEVLIAIGGRESQPGVTVAVE